MDIYEAWNRALKNTEIIRPRIQALKTFNQTFIPYILLSESAVNQGDTVIRKGEVVVDKPALILPPHHPVLKGFDFETRGDFEEENILNFLLVRGINLPSLKYDNKTYSLDVYEDSLSRAIEHFHQKMRMEEDVVSGLIAGPEDCWQFSLLIYTCSQIARNAERDIRLLLEQFKKHS